MQQVVNINGYETVIEIPEGQALSPVTHSGDKSDFRIEYGNGLVKVGGIVEIECGNVTPHLIEGVKVMELPFSQVYNFQVTAMNVSSNPANISNEGAFITEQDGVYKIYAHAKASSTYTIPVKWAAEGYI